nr:TAT-variant-translocated molybdopterin oxidoreductase [Methylobacterium mesophilicum]
MTPGFDIAVLREKLAGGDGPRFWRSLDAVADSPEFRDYLAAEFPSAARLAAAPERRGFLKLMAASFALGGLTACGSGGGRAYEVPYVNQPERIVPGTDLSYASSALFDGFGNGVLVTTRNGRPLKIEGNPDHPWSRGGTDVLAQASVLGLYDPFRSQAVQHLGRPSSWAAFRADLQARMPAWRQSGGEGIALLTGPVTSPSVAAQIARLRAAYPALRWYGGAGAGRDGILRGCPACLRAAAGDASRFRPCPHPRGARRRFPGPRARPGRPVLALDRGPARRLRAGAPPHPPRGGPDSDADQRQGGLRRPRAGRPAGGPGPEPPGSGRRWRGPGG